MKSTKVREKIKTERLVFCKPDIFFLGDGINLNWENFNSEFGVLVLEEISTLGALAFASTVAERWVGTSVEHHHQVITFTESLSESDGHNGDEKGNWFG